MIDEVLNVAGLLGADVNAFLLGECGRVSAGSAKGRVGELRGVLRFLYLQGLTPLRLWTAVPPVGAAQVLPQAPQLFTSAASDLHVPALVGVAPQTVWSTGQVPPQVPVVPVQVAVPPVGFAHTFPHTPQLLASLEASGS